jgi:hypothetical protein
VGFLGGAREAVASEGDDGAEAGAGGVEAVEEVVVEDDGGEVGEGAELGGDAAVGHDERFEGGHVLDAGGEPAADAVVAVVEQAEDVQVAEVGGERALEVVVERHDLLQSRPQRGDRLGDAPVEVVVGQHDRGAVRSPERVRELADKVVVVHEDRVQRLR